MPNKTIYVREADVPLLEMAANELGESISALFASFLHDRVARMTSQEKEVVQLIKRFKQDGERLAREGTHKEALADLEQAEAYLHKVLEAIRKGDQKTAIDLWCGAKSCHESAHQNHAEYQKIFAKIGIALRGASPTNGSSAGASKQ